MTQKLIVRTLTANDVVPIRAMLTMFGDAFGERETYTSAQPDDAYLQRLLARDSFIAVSACLADKVIGGIVAYVLPKFERLRMELYIYDLAVDAAYRRRGVATAMIEELKIVAAARGIEVIFVQADHGDDAAIAFYAKLGGIREDVLHFDIPLSDRAS